MADIECQQPEDALAGTLSHNDTGPKTVCLFKESFKFLPLKHHPLVENTNDQDLDTLVINESLFFLNLKILETNS